MILREALSEQFGESASLFALFRILIYNLTTRNFCIPYCFIF